MLNVGYKHDVVMWWNSTKSSKKITLSPNQYKWIIRNASLLFKLFLLLWVALYTFLSCNYSLLCIMCSLHGHWTGIPWTKIKKDSIKITVNTISTIVTQKTIECPRYFSFVISINTFLCTFYLKSIIRLQWYCISASPLRMPFNGGLS